MKWEELTSEELKKAAEEGLVAILPLGSLEIHGPHLPLGTDAMAIYRLAVEASQREPAVVLPPLYYTCVVENRHFPGTISIRALLLFKLLSEICNEVARNGFRKILILNGHGGNRRILRLFVRELLWKRHPYQLYVLYDPWAPIQDVINKLKETKEIGHACEIETSYMLYLFPDLVKLERVKGPASTGTTPSIPNVETPIDWPSLCVSGYLGDPRKASVDKGRILFEQWVSRVAKILRLIKEDKIVEQVLDRYFNRVRGGMIR